MANEWANKEAGAADVSAETSRRISCDGSIVKLIEDETGEAMDYDMAVEVVLG